MKRGFLKSSKAKACPLGPELGTVISLIYAICLIVPAIQRPNFVPRAKHRVAFLLLKSESKEYAPSKPSIPNLDIPGFDMPSIPHGTFHTMSPRGVMCTTLPVGAGPGQPVSECLLFPGCKEALFSLPGFPRPLLHPATPAFRISKISGKATGLFSTRALKTGDLILSDADVEKYFQLSVSRMRPEAESAFMALAGSPKEDGSGPVIDIVRAHGLTLDGLWPSGNLQGHTYRAVCKMISYLSHSNSPNTAPRFDLQSFSYRLFAFRDIAAGEELTSTDTYLDCLTAQPRPRMLMAVDEMPCTVSLFNKPCKKTLLQLSLDLWLRDDTLADDWLIIKCQEVLALPLPQNATETDFRSRLEAMYTLMQSYICLGDAHGASKWAKKMHAIFPRGEMETNALLDPASAAYQADSLWRHRVDRELAKGMQQPVLVNDQLLFPMEWWHSNGKVETTPRWQSWKS
ncbi:hypothetical protein B0H19DRAFT_1249728 [Mycena capillaripes]|nr:hypothetical protein B0H19DRAFT_1249728 [Mycena capillaripes]